MKGIETIVGGVVSIRLCDMTVTAVLFGRGVTRDAEPFPTSTLGLPRGRTNSPGKVTLPYGWLNDRDDCTVPVDAEMDDSGG